MKVPNIIPKLFLLGMLGTQTLWGQGLPPNSPLTNFYIGIYCEDADGVINDGISNDPVGLDHDYLKAVADDHFNLIICTEPTRQVPTPTTPLAFLDRIHALGMQAIIYSDGIDVEKPTPTFDQSLVQNTINHYLNHPALAGYGVADEPCSAMFPVIGDIHTEIQTLAPGKIPYTNLWASYAPVSAFEDCSTASGPSSNWVSYETSYLDEYINTAHPSHLSIDYYTLYGDNRNCHWLRWMWQDYDMVARKAVQHNIPHYFVLSLPVRKLDANCQNIDPATPQNHDNISSLPLPYFRYIYYSALIHGARGLFFWTRDRKIYSNTMFMNFWDTPDMTAHRAEMNVLNQKMMSHLPVLANLTYKNSFHVTNYPTMRESYTLNLHDMFPTYMDWVNASSEPIYSNHFNPNPAQVLFPQPHSMPSVDLDPINNNIMTDYLVFSFLEDNAGGEYFWVMNKNIDNPATFTISFNGPKTISDVLHDRICVNTEQYQVSLQAGDGKLFRIASYYPSMDPLVVSNWVPAGFVGTAMTGEVDFQNTNTIASGNIAGFYGELIHIGGNFGALPGSWVALSSDIPFCYLFKTESLDAQYPALIDPGTWEVFPNPTQGQFSLSGILDEEEIANLQLLDINGRIIYQEQATSSNGTLLKTFDLSGVASGIFFLKIEAAGKIHSFKIIKH